jgi:hypothetical protein
MATWSTPSMARRLGVAMKYALVQRTANFRSSVPHLFHEVSPEVLLQCVEHEINLLKRVLDISLSQRPAFSAASSFLVFSGLSSIGAASQRSRIKWTSFTENREIKKRVHPVGASAEINPPGTNAFMVCGLVRFVHGERGRNAGGVGRRCPGLTGCCFWDSPGGHFGCGAGSGLRPAMHVIIQFIML